MVKRLRGRVGAVNAKPLHNFDEEHLTYARIRTAFFLQSPKRETVFLSFPRKGPPARRRSQFFLPRLKAVGIQIGGFMKLADRQYLYPDLTVACGEQAGTMLTSPVVVIEVLSPTTEKRDRGAKFKTYKALPSVQEYVLIGSEYRAIEVHQREGNFWRQYHYREGDLVELKSIGVSFPFDALYRRIPI